MFGVPRLRGLFFSHNSRPAEGGSPNYRLEFRVYAGFSFRIIPDRLKAEVRTIAWSSAFTRAFLFA